MRKPIIAALEPIIAALGVALLAGCGDRPEPLMVEEVGTPRAGLASTAADTLAEEAGRPDEVLSTRIAKSVGRFGGFSFDSTGTLVAYLVGPRTPADERLVRSMLAEHHGRQSRLLSERGIHSDIEIREAQYTFAQLQRFRRRLNEDVLAIPGVVFTDLDEFANRYVIGVDRSRAAEAQGEIQRLSRRRGVPNEALSFELRSVRPDAGDVCSEFEDNCACSPTDLTCQEPTDPCLTDPLLPGCDDGSAATPSSDIREKVRPIRGGIQVEGAGGSLGTLGFIAWYCVEPELSDLFAYDCQHWFVVTSHQTRDFARVDQTVFFQPNSFYGGEQIGREEIDTPWHTYGFTINPDGASFLGTTCQAPEHYRSVVCRRSDMALVRPSTGQIDFGYLVRPARRYSDPWDHSTEQFAVDASNPRMRIIDEAELGVGFQVDKIGITTGWRTGRVTRTCVDIARQSNQFANYVLRCQTEMAIHHRRGDSGGPVFWYHADGTVSLAGIFHGSTSYGVGSNNDYGYYSPLSMIRNDLGLTYYDRQAFSVVRR